MDLDSSSGRFWVLRKNMAEIIQFVTHQKAYFTLGEAFAIILIDTLGLADRGDPLGLPNSRVSLIFRKKSDLA